MSIPELVDHDFFPFFSIQFPFYLLYFICLFHSTVKKGLVSSTYSLCNKILKWQTVKAMLGIVVLYRAPHEPQNIAVVTPVTFLHYEMKKTSWKKYSELKQTPFKGILVSIYVTFYCNSLNKLVRGCFKILAKKGEHLIIPRGCLIVGGASRWFFHFRFCRRGV